MMCTSLPLPQNTTSQRSEADDFLNALLHESSSVPASPLWSPCTTDSGINEDPLTDPTDSPHPISCTAFPAFDVHTFLPPPSSEDRPPANEKTSDVSIDLGKTRMGERAARWCGG